MNISKIKKIRKIGSLETIDIEVSDNNLFIANGILTHNSGFQSSDLEMSDTSESFGIPAVSDSMFAFTRTDELDRMNQILIKQLKNRYKDTEFQKRFTVGVDRAKMKLYDIDDPISNVMNSSSTKSSDDIQTPFSSGRLPKSFEGFKV